MARNLTSGVKTQLTSGNVRLAFFVQANFVSGPTYIWNGLGSITWNSQTWSGVGNMVTISAVSESNDMSARNITLTLNGIPSGLLGQCLTEVRQNNLVQVWFGFIDSAGAVIVDPYKTFSGHMDVPTINEGMDSSTIDLTCENPLIDMARAPARRFTHDDQKISYPTDNGFQFVAPIQEWNGTWGKAGPGGTPGGVPSSPPSPPPPKYPKNP